MRVSLSWTVIASDITTEPMPIDVAGLSLSRGTGR
jgi:hypothetical protein